MPFGQRLKKNDNIAYIAYKSCNYMIYIAIL
jgi:hypothetical protein